MRQIVLAPLILALGLPVQAGLPEDLKDKWIKVDKNWTIDTGPGAVQVKSNGIIRFWVDRKATDGEFSGSGRKTMTWVGRIRINCKNFKWKTEKNLPGPIGGFEWHSTWSEITPGFQQDLASYFCFLTKVPGYTRESSEPKWVSTAIKNVELKKARQTKSKFNRSMDMDY